MRPEQFTVRTALLTTALVVAAAEAFGQAVAGDFDGDRKADLTQFRSMTGAWSTLGSTTSGLITFGGNRDVPTAADYDGDGRTDVAVFRVGSSAWHIRQSGTLTVETIGWGGVGDSPVPEDYDGDGKADVAVFRATTGRWYVRQSSTFTMTEIAWGGIGDISVPADYDGDRKADVAVFRGSTSTWYIRQSATWTMKAITWGGGADVPVPGDYDGDGKTDLAVFRPSTGEWFIRPSSSWIPVVMLWGVGTDTPVPGDYDGDGRTDVAVFRPSEGVWYIRQSFNQTMRTAEWGAYTDNPILARRGTAPLVRVVDDDGQATAADCSAAAPASATIGAAIAVAASGETVLVCPGTYAENVNFGGKDIIVRSSDGPAVTVIDGNLADSVVAFVAGEGPRSVLDGFTVRNGRSGFDTPGFGDGGGIRIADSSPTILNNAILANRSCAGAGIAVSFGSPWIEGNTISWNQQAGCTGGPGGGGILLVNTSAPRVIGNAITDNAMGSDGGGISLFSAGEPLIERNFIARNQASSGGGLWIVNWSDATLTGNLIVGNSAIRSGGGVYWLVPQGARGPLLANNTIAANTSAQGGGLAADGFDAEAVAVNNVIVAAPGQVALWCGTFNDLNPPVLRFNNVFGGVGGTAFGGSCGDPTGTNGNISADPLFADAASGDYHLLAGSPNIDAGDAGSLALPVVDFDVNSRVVDGNGDGTPRVDIGADEFVLEVDHAPTS